MSKWKKDATSFSVGIYYNRSKGSTIRVPLPILKILGNPKQITFKIHDSIIEITKRKSSKERKEV